MADSGAGGTQKGRRQPSIVLDNFDKLGGVGNKSNRYYWACKHCAANQSKHGASIENRDNNLLKHLIDKQKCPECPQKTRMDAYNALRAKGAVDAAEVLLPDDPTITNTNTSDISMVSEGLSNPVKRKRTGEHIERHFDTPLSEAQQERVDVKLLR